MTYFNEILVPSDPAAGTAHKTIPYFTTRTRRIPCKTGMGRGRAS